MGKGNGYMRVCCKEKKKGEYFPLYKELVEDSLRFHQYFIRLVFKNLSLIEEDLMKKNTTFSEAISPRKNLSVFLR
jgi:predicted  nucleic acid-binding Zn ribbon protein